MENLIFSLNATVPIFLLMILGLLFHKIGWIDDVFAQKADLYGKEVKMLAGMINANDFTGAGGTSRATISLMRG